ncbi:hypothetical protein M758_4G193800 [Ceratodon purpureus]|nr:hypothetical protein M758_4G193800 [Ceratodon purpureus]
MRQRAPGTKKIIAAPRSNDGAQVTKGGENQRRRESERLTPQKTGSVAQLEHTVRRESRERGRACESLRQPRPFMSSRKSVELQIAEVQNCTFRLADAVLTSVESRFTNVPIRLTYLTSILSYFTLFYF